MGASEDRLKDLYKSKDTDELMTLYQSGDLSDIAASICHEELVNREIPAETMHKLRQEQESNQIPEQIVENSPERVLRKIKISVYGFYGMAAIVIALSAMGNSWIGVLIGVFIGGVAISADFTKKIAIAYLFPVIIFIYIAALIYWKVHVGLSLIIFLVVGIALTKQLIGALKQWQSIHK